MTRHEALNDREIRLETMFGLDAVINPNGAFIESVRAHDKDLIMPRQEIDGKDRGGIPICAPVFGPAEQLGLNQHGFARNLPWEVGQQSQSGLTMSLEIDDGKCSEYDLPKEYLGCSMEAILMMKSTSATSHWLNAILKIKNGNPKEDIVAAPGLHPYFPISPKQGADGVMIDIGNTSRTFNAISLEKSVRLPQPMGKISFDLRDESGSSISVEIKSAELMNYVLWTTSPDKYICVEPTSGGAVGAERTLDDLYKFYGLAPGQTKSYATRITWRQ